VLFVTLHVWEDARGWFAETYKTSDYLVGGVDLVFVQENQSVSTSRFVLRGLHYQVEPRAHAKLVRCLEGQIFDVAVDLRRDSPTYRRYASTVLSGTEPRCLWIPKGFAHGFLTLTERASVLYKQTAEYSPAHERAVRWNDPALNIAWPLGGAQPLLSEKDEHAPLLVEMEAVDRAGTNGRSASRGSFEDRK
jgi:dTDP-4-dehydrorhamnose 3,5-epimerase